eukprot:3636919-Rhodomonas_salina.3
MITPSGTGTGERKRVQPTSDPGWSTGRLQDACTCLLLYAWRENQSAAACTCLPMCARRGGWSTFAAGTCARCAAGLAVSTGPDFTKFQPLGTLVPWYPGTRVQAVKRDRGLGFTRHIHVCRYYVRDLVQEGTMALVKCAGTHNVADALRLTKSLPSQAHRGRHRDIGRTSREHGQSIRFSFTHSASRNPRPWPVRRRDGL